MTGVRVLVIGLDGASFDLLDPVMADGDMPTLARLVAHGTRGVLASVVPPITPSAWSSFLTGKEPGKHGIYDFRLYDPRTGRDAFVTSRSLREPTLWQLATAAGKRVGVVNLAMHYPPDPSMGTVVSGFDTPSTEVAFTHPPELRDWILARHPDYTFVASPRGANVDLRNAAELGDFLDRVERALGQQADVALHLLGQGAWDAFMVHFQSVDAMQHRIWPIFANRTREPERWNRVRRVYRALDAHLAALVAAVPNATVMVLSDHGFGEAYGRIHANTLLQQWGLLEWRGRRRQKVERRVRKWLGLKKAKDAAAGPWVRQLQGHTIERVLPLRWNKTRAYVATGHQYGLVWVNLRGRDPHGIVDTGRAYDRLRDDLRERFLGLRDPQHGGALVSAVEPGERAYVDDRAGRRPDLVIIPAPGWTISRTLTPRSWLVRYVSGTHRPEGVLVASGSGIRAGERLPGARIIDVAPTLLAALDVPIPDDVDGRPLDGLFVSPPVARFASGAATTSAPTELTAEEEDALADRLRGLGYVE